MFSITAFKHLSQITEERICSPFWFILSRGVVVWVSAVDVSHRRKCIQKVKNKIRYSMSGPRKPWNSWYKLGLSCKQTCAEHWWTIMSNNMNLFSRKVCKCGCSSVHVSMLCGWGSSASPHAFSTRYYFSAKWKTTLLQSPKLLVFDSQFLARMFLV